MPSYDNVRVSRPVPQQYPPSKIWEKKGEKEDVLEHIYRNVKKVDFWRMLVIILHEDSCTGQIWLDISEG